MEVLPHLLHPFPIRGIKRAVSGRPHPSPIRGIYPNITGMFWLLNSTSMCVLYATQFCEAFLLHKKGVPVRLEAFFLAAHAQWNPRRGRGGGQGISWSAIIKSRKHLQLCVSFWHTYNGQIPTKLWPVVLWSIYQPRKEKRKMGLPVHGSNNNQKKDWCKSFDIVLTGFLCCLHAPYPYLILKGFQLIILGRFVPLVCSIFFVDCQLKTPIWSSRDSG